MSCDEKIRFISTSTVRPAAGNVDTMQRIELTPWDLRMLFVQCIQKGLLFPKQEGITRSTIINHLKTSLSLTLNHFFPLAGRLGVTKHEDDNTISVHINCNSAGAEFIHAAIDITISDLLNPTYLPSSMVQQFFSPDLKELINSSGRFQPLLSIQITELLDGIFIGCTVNHVVCDGTSFWHFLNSWSEICRTGSKNISRPPILKRWFLDNTSCPIRLHFSNEDEFFSEKYRDIMPPLEERIFHFTRQNILRLKAKANEENNTDGHVVISSLQALLAHIWIAVIRARRLDPNEETKYMLLIGHRTRLSPPLPETYFGNSVSITVASTKAGELLEKGIGFGALLLNRTVMSHSDSSVRRSLESWLERPVFICMNDLVSTPHPHLITGSSPRFDIYGNDFGWGRPIAVRSGIANKYNGKITVYPGSVEGSIDFEACLSLDTLKAMEDDAEFMEAVSVLPPF